MKLADASRRTVTPTPRVRLLTPPSTYSRRATSPRLGTLPSAPAVCVCSTHLAHRHAPGMSGIGCCFAGLPRAQRVVAVALQSLLRSHDGCGENCRERSRATNLTQFELALVKRIGVTEELFAGGVAEEAERVHWGACEQRWYDALPPVYDRLWAGERKQPYQDGGEAAAHNHWEALTVPGPLLLERSPYRC